MEIHYEIEGTPNSPVLVLSNSLGSDLRIWQEVSYHLLPYFQILRYDMRGHGKSDTQTGDYSIAELGTDLLNVLDKLKIKTFSFCGVSLGGLIGQWLAINHPQRLEKLVLSNTAAKIGTEAGWNERIRVIREQGFQSILDETMHRWFSERFLENNPDKREEMKNMFLQNDPEGYIGCCTALREADFSDKIKNINVPTLVITGRDDEVTTVQHAETLADQIPEAITKVLSGCHIQPVENPEIFAVELIQFLVGKDKAATGMHIRKSVLGLNYVNQAIQNTNTFNADFQKLVTEFPWAAIWSRPGLTKHQRSLITLAMLIPLNRPAEFKMHIRAALHNGVTLDEIRELILHSSIYCGFPAANESFKIAEQILKEEGFSFNEEGSSDHV